MQRILFTFLLLIAITLGASANKLQSPQLDKAATVGVLVKDLRTGRILAATEPDKAMVPASIQKSLPVAAALTHLGPDYVYVTTVTATGEKCGTTLNGDIVITPSGDPSIGADFVDSLVAAVKDAGIATIKGTVKVADVDWPEQGVNPNWEVDDTYYDYGVGWYAFNFDHNMAMGLNRKRRKCKMPTDDPAKVGVNKIVNALEANGVQVLKKMVRSSRNEDPQVILEYTSAPLSQLCADLMRVSDNMWAEAVLRLMAPGKGIDNALAAQDSVLTSLGVDLTAKCQLDGSGLSRGNNVTPRTMASLLEAMSTNPCYVNSFPVVGCEGTVKKLLNDTPLQGQLRLKSGSMRRVLCYAGYKIDSDGCPTHLVVVIVNNSAMRFRGIKHSIEEFLLEVF